MAARPLAGTTPKEVRHGRHAHRNVAIRELAEDPAADRVRRNLADRRHPEMVAPVPFRLHGYPHGTGPGPARLAQAMVRLLDQPATPAADILRLPRRCD